MGSCLKAQSGIYTMDPANDIERVLQGAPERSKRPISSSSVSTTRPQYYLILVENLRGQGR